MSCGGGVHFLVHSWSNICHLGCQSAVLIAIRAALTMLDRSLRERHVLKNNIDAFPQPTIQPTKCDVLYDLRSVWQSPHVCQVVVIPNPAVLSRQRSRVRVSSSPPLLSKGITGRDTGNSNPQLNSQLLVHCGAHPHCAQEFALCCPCFIAVFLRVQIERRLNLAVTQDSLHGLGFDFRLVHQPIAKRVT